MRKKNVYLLGVNRHPHIPYALGLIWAYAVKHTEVQENYQLKEIIFLRDNISDVINRMEKPVILAVSNYIWNQRYNNELSRRVKEKWPECSIIYGGPNIQENDTRFFNKHPFVDIIVRKEGEITFYSILEELCKENPSFEGIAGTSFLSSNGEYIRNQDRERITDLSVFPSPYLEGHFNKLDAEIKKRFGPGVGMDATLQTNRGCPRKCSFCSIGNEYYNKVSFFPIERVLAEIDWISEHNVIFVNSCDSNFGLFPRDLEIAEYLTEKKKKNGFPEKIRIDWCGSPKENALKAAKVLNDCNLSRGVTIAIQSISAEVSKAIKREKRSIIKYSELNNEYVNRGIATYAELILPLPEETYDSFLNGFSTLIENGQNNCINVYDCCALPNTNFTETEYGEKHGFKIVSVPQIHYHIADYGHCPDNPREYSENILTTNTMPWEDWIRAKLWVYATTIGHFFGLTHYIVRFLLKYRNVGVRKFYENFLIWSSGRNGRFSKSIQITLSMLNKVTLGEPALEREIIDIHSLGGIIWRLDEAMFIDGYLDRKNFYSELETFIKHELDIENIDENLLEEALLFNKQYLINHEESYPKYQLFKWNLEEYVFVKGSKLKKENTITKFDSIEYHGDLRKFLRERIWYSRQIGGARASIGREGIKPSPIDQSHSNDLMDRVKYRKSQEKP